MIEPISYQELISSLEERLEIRLKRARVFPSLLQSCQPYARRIRFLKTIRNLGAELFLSDYVRYNSGEVRYAHPIPNDKIKLFNICRDQNLYHFALNRELYVDTEIKHGGKAVLIHLGEWRAFVEFSGDPLEMSSKEFLEVCKKIKRYCEKVKSGFTVNEERLTNGRPVFLARDWEATKEYRYVGQVSGFTEYIDAYVKYTKEDWEREERAEAEKFHEELRMHEELMGRGRIIDAGDDYVISEISPEDVERTLNIPVKEVAEKVLAIKSRYHLFDSVGISVLTPLKHLHALRYLMDAGVEAQLVRSEALKLRLGIQVYIRYVAHHYYSVIIIPKKLHQLPPIRLAKVIKSQKRIVVVD